MQYLYENLDHTVKTEDVEIKIFKKELVDIWESAFEHVICGQPGHNKKNILGGLHYVSRYLDLQKNNWGGLKSCKEFPIVKFPVYTIGVDFLNSSGTISTKCPISYNYNISVIDFIIEGTKAFKESNGSSGICTYSNNGVDYTFVSRNKKIVTLYPNIRSTAPSCRISN